MMNMIDKDVLKQRINTAFWSEIENIIDSAPSIDIVPCSECKYNSICNRGVQHTTRDMSSITIGYKSVDFCSYGEREGEQ